MAKKWMPYVMAVSLLTLCNLFYFRDQLAGKKIIAQDEISYLGTAAELQQYYNANREQSLWTNSLFGGMPTYQIDKLPLGWTPLQTVKSFIGLNTDPMLYYFIGMSLLCLLLFCICGINIWLAAIGAFAFTYATDHAILAIVGHYTKLDALMFLPLILGGLILVFEQRLILGFILFTLGLIFNLQANHLQMTYYILLASLVYVIIECIYAYRSAQWKRIIRSGTTLGIGVSIAILANIAHLYTTYDYAQDTVRGKKILTTEATAAVQSPTSGLSWTYAAESSNGFLDVLAMIIPGVVGGSSAEKIPSRSAIDYQFQRARPPIAEPHLASLYWGELPVTAGPSYAGIVSFVLFLFGAFYVQGRIKYWAVATLIFLAIQSLGDNFFLNKVFFEYLPFYNRFRTPNSILLVATSIIPLFGFYALHRVMLGTWDRASILVVFKKSVFPLLGFLGIVFVAGWMFFDFTRPGDDLVWNDQAALISTRRTLMLGDTIRTFLLACGTAAALYLVLSKQIKPAYFISILAILMLLDLWPISLRYLYDKSHKEDKVVQKEIKRRNTDLVILRDRDPYFRVLDLSVNTYSDAKASMYHKSVGGYHPAKLRRYSDVIDKYLLAQDTGVLAMLNTKYIIDPNNVVKKNPAANGNVWFVDTVIPVSNPNEELDRLGTTDLTKSAIVLAEDFPGYLDSTTFTPSGSIKLTSYSANRLQYQSNATTPQLAIFSDIWYGPDKGWQAFMDGQAVDHIRANYILRALKVPAGTHTIEFKFYPTKVLTMIKLNKVVQWMVSIILLAGLLYLIVKFKRSKGIAASI